MQVEVLMKPPRLKMTLVAPSGRMATANFFPDLPAADRVVQSEGLITVRLLAGERLYIGGYGLIRPVLGPISVFGAVLDPEAGCAYPFYSCKASAIIHVAPAGACTEAHFTISALEDGLDRLTEGELSVKDVFSFAASMATTVPNVYLVPGPDSGCIPFDLPTDWAAVSTGVAQSAASTPTVFVVGPRKMGKSTMSRFLANSIWSRTQRVAFLDTDLGQTEFTPPGCVSLKILDREPLLGPPVSHQGLTEGLIFLGCMSPQENPKAYLDACSRLLHRYMAEFHANGIPLIVNTMGWTTGLGMSLLQALLHVIPVSHMVAFGQGEQSPFDYVQDALFRASDFSKGRVFTADDAPSIAHVQPAEASGSQSLRVNRVTPADQRALTFSAYFLGRYDPGLGRMVFPGGALSFRTCVPVAVSMDLVRFTRTSHGGPGQLEALAANLAVVGLATYSERTKVPECVGLGLVRSVDRRSRLLYVLTPVPVELLCSANVNCLVLGDVYLPSTFLTGTDNADGPYLSYTGTNAAAGHTARKARTNLNRKWAS